MKGYTVYTKENCPWCSRAVALLEAFNATYRLVEGAAPDMSTWPVIYEHTSDGQRLIGGYDELRRRALSAGL
jgi:hypothetical protein